MVGWRWEVPQRDSAVPKDTSCSSADVPCPAALLHQWGEEEMLATSPPATPLTLPGERRQAGNC